VVVKGDVAVAVATVVAEDEPAVTLVTVREASAVVGETVLVDAETVAETVANIAVNIVAEDVDAVAARLETLRLSSLMMKRLSLPLAPNDHFKSERELGLTQSLVLTQSGSRFGVYCQAHARESVLSYVRHSATTKKNF